MIQIVCAYVAEGQQMRSEEISLENLFYDTHCQLIAWSELIEPALTVQHLGAVQSS